MTQKTAARITRICSKREITTVCLVGCVAVYVMVALSMISAFLFVHADPRGSVITWGAAGVIGAFSIFGAFSIGFFYLPVALMFGFVSIIWDVRNRQNIPLHLGVFLIAGILQLALMFVFLLQR